MKGNRLVFTCILLVVTLIFWLYFFSAATSIKVGEPLPIGNSFDGNEQIPIKEFKEKYNAGVTILERQKSNIHIYRILSAVSEWLTFVLSSIITIFLAIQGKLFQPDSKLQEVGKLIPMESEKYKNTNKRLMIIASVCSILIAFGSICKLKLESSLKNATDMNAALYKSRAGWFNAKTAQEASNVLEELDKYLINNQ